jgi:hypothetical protein
MNVLFGGITVALFVLSLLQSYYRQMKIKGIKIGWYMNHSKMQNMAATDKGQYLTRYVGSRPTNSLRLTAKPMIKVVKTETLVKYTCRDCEFCLKGNAAFYSCLNTEEGILGMKETHPLYPVCPLFARKNKSDTKSTGLDAILAA